MSQRGAAPVGYLDEMEPLEVSVIRYMRLWCSGPDCQAEVWNDFAVHFGARDGQAHLKSFERMMSTLMSYGRRPFMRHQLDCRCVGGHECALATLIAAAAEANREEAVLMASLLVRADMATTLAAEAEQVGMALRVGVLRQRAAGKLREMPAISATRH